MPFSAGPSAVLFDPYTYSARVNKHLVGSKKNKHTNTNNSSILKAVNSCPTRCSGCRTFYFESRNPAYAYSLCTYKVSEKYFSKKLTIV